MSTKTIQERKPRKKVAIYIRVSTEGQAEDGNGPELQLEKINQYLKLRDDELEFAGTPKDGRAELEDEFVFFDKISGTTDIYLRPQFDRMLEYITSEDCPFDTVIVYKLDRFARSLLILLNIVDLFKKNQISFISAQESIDTNSIMGNAMIGFLGIIAQLERETIKERTKGGRDISRKQKGIYQVAPYGYIKNSERTIDINPETGPIIRRIFDMFVNDGLSAGTIANILEKENILTPSHSTKHQASEKMRNPYLRRDSSIRTILGNKAYIGEYWFNGGSNMSDIQHDPIISKEQFEIAQVLLSKKGGYIKPESSYLLGGLLKCDCCKHGRSKPIQWVGTTKGTNRYYQCGGKNTAKNDIVCNVVSLQKEALEQLVITKIKEFILKPEKLKLIYEESQKRNNISKIEQDMAAIRKQIEQYNISIAKTKQLYRNSHDTYEEWLENTESYEKNIKELRIKLKELSEQKDRSSDMLKYQKVLQYISHMTDENIDNIFSNHETAKILISYIISEIVVYSRPATEADKIQGRPKQNGGVQMVPYHIDIKFNTPDVIMSDMLKEELGETNGDKETTTNTNKIKLKNKSNSKLPKNRIITQDPEKILQIFGISKEQIIKEIYNYKKEGGTIYSQYQSLYQKISHCCEIF